MVCLSTDKAVYPINAMGMSKAMMEKVLIAKSRVIDGSGTVHLGDPLRQRPGLARVGHSAVRGAGSARRADHDHRSGDDAVRDDARRGGRSLPLRLQHGDNGDIFVQKAPAVTIEDFAQAVLRGHGPARPPDPGDRHAPRREAVSRRC